VTLRSIQIEYEFPAVDASQFMAPIMRLVGLIMTVKTPVVIIDKMLNFAFCHSVSYSAKYSSFVLETIQRAIANESRMFEPVFDLTYVGRSCEVFGLTSDAFNNGFTFPFG
jgi:hypothetical protein